MGPEPRPELVDLPPVVHGGSDRPGVLDFSTGISPLPPPGELLDAVRTAELSRYPHPTAAPARDAIGALHALPPDQIVVGAGSVELIWALARAFGGAGRTGLVVTPAFGEYEQALRASGASVVQVAMRAPDFALPVDALARSLADTPIAIAFICRPSNPCLTVAPADGLTDLARRWPGTLFVLDEAYLPMFEGVEGVAPDANVAVLRSMTKVFALPGVRLGYVLASRSVAAAAQATLPPWNVSSPAQAAAVSASRLLPADAPAIRAALSSLRGSLARALDPLVGPPARSGGPFLLYEIPDALELTARLREGRVLVRHAASFGLPRHVRIGTRLAGDNATLAELWRAVHSSVPGPSAPAGRR